MISFNYLRITFFFLLLGITASCATQGEAGLEDLSVIHVRIIEARELAFLHEGESDTCGINYSAKILNSYKGNRGGQALKFSSPFSLIVGHEYILITGRTHAVSSLIVDWPRDYEQAFSKCEEDLYPLILQSNDAMMIWDYPYDLDGKWVMVEDGNMPFEKQLSGKERRCLYGEGECLFIRLSDMVRILEGTD